MIISLFIILGALILNLIAVVFSGLSFVLPSELSDAVIYFLGELDNLSFIFPVNTLLQATGVLLSFMGSFYTVKLFMWMYSLIPYFGRQVDLPKMTVQDTFRSRVFGYSRRKYKDFGDKK